MSLLKTTKNALVRKYCIEVIPAMYKSIQEMQKGEHLDAAMKAILDFIKTPNNKERGQGFISMGKMSGQVQHRDFEKYIDPILLLIHDEVKVPPRAKDGLIKL